MLLDTNVVSELLKPDCHPGVRSWSEQAPRSHCHISSITSYEIAYGIVRLDAGKRRDRLPAAWAVFVADFIVHQVLAMNHVAAARGGQLRAELVAQGFNHDICDLFIASIAIVHNATVVTRNIRHFNNMSLSIINPWEPPAS